MSQRELKKHKKREAQLISIWGYVITSFVCLLFASYDLYVTISDGIDQEKSRVIEETVVVCLILGIVLSCYGLIKLARRAEDRIGWRLVIGGISVGALGAVFYYFAA